MVVSTVASQLEGSRFESRGGRDLSVWSWHALPVSAWVLSGFSGFLPPSKSMTVRLIDYSKLPVGVHVSVSGCVSLFVLHVAL